MFLFTIAFLFGDLYLQQFEYLPDQLTVFVLLLSSLIFYCNTKNYWSHSYLCFAVALGFTFSFLYVQNIFSFSLSKNLESQTTVIRGHVASIPNLEPQTASFMFELNQINYHTVHNRPLIKLSWHKPDTIQVGDEWLLHVRLKRVHAIQNPGGFDFEAWALQQGLRAMGYVVSNTKNQFIAHDYFRYPIHQIRQKIKVRIENILPPSQTKPWIIALMVGERSGVAQDDWQILRNTGTNHLMAIAGLHIGILFGFAHAFFLLLWRRLPKLMLKVPAQLGALCSAFVLCLIYSALAGFSIPTQRACIMLGVFILNLLARKKTTAWNSWSLALLLVLILNPLSVLSDSFWLSFGTIALIIYGMSGRLAPKNLWWKWGRVQWVISFGLMPLSLLLFQECSIISFVANSIAIPWLAFLILPFCFLGTLFLYLSPAVGKYFLLIADQNLSGLWKLLTWFAQLHYATWQHAIPSTIIFFISLIGILLLMLPAGFAGRCLGLIWLMPLIFYQPIKPRMGDFWMTLLDVGQGLSVVIQTHKHTLIYDTGPRFANQDTGERVLLPYLRMLAITELDSLIISHGDNDHIGGATILLKTFPIRMIKSSVPDKLTSASYCLSGDTWQWDQVQFSILYPTTNDLHLGNDSSCVLQIDNGVQKLLLTGDIEKHAEKNLLARISKQLSADVLIAPHHGSKTSGLKEFIYTVAPSYVLFPIGYRNRYHFPHPSVIQTYQQIHAKQLDTAHSGAIQMKFDKTKQNLQVQEYRLKHKHYWHDV